MENVWNKGSNQEEATLGFFSGSELLNGEYSTSFTDTNIFSERDISLIRNVAKQNSEFKVGLILLYLSLNPD